MARAAIEVEGLKEFRKELRQLADGKTWSRELGQVQRHLAKKVAGWAQGDARGMGGSFAHFAGSVKGAGGVAGAKIAVDPKANATFWGAKKRTGWNARNPNSRAQHPEWVGSSWDVGVQGQGPYAINSAIASHLPEIEREYWDGLEGLFARAFPD